MKPQTHSWFYPLVALANNPISLIGVICATTGGVLWFFTLAADVGSGVENPYVGILAFLALPAIFFLGLVLIPLGIHFKRRSEGKGGITQPPGEINLNSPAVRRVGAFLLAATAANVVIGASYMASAVQYMGSVGFCGTACHTMTPEFSAYQQFAHSKVDCVHCHVAPGAAGFVESKVRGAGQLLAMTTNSYSRPIETPVHGIASTQVTCEGCHARGKEIGNQLRVIRHFSDDEANTPSTSVLLLRVGGANHAGIHGAHLRPGRVIEYRSDPKRETIPWIRVTDAGGQSEEYVAEGADMNGMEMRTMDCADCHNRPAHTFEMPDDAVDRAIAAGRMDRGLPFLRKQSLELLRASYASGEEAAEKIPSGLQAFYQENHSGAAGEKAEAIRQAGAELVQIWSRNVFPQMKVSWGTYPNHLGHQQFPGCFRCHDDSHTSASGKTVSQDCSSCHEMLAMEEESPEVLKALSLAQQ